MLHTCVCTLQKNADSKVKIDKKKRHYNLRLSQIVKFRPK